MWSIEAVFFEDIFPMKKNVEILDEVSNPSTSRPAPDIPIENIEPRRSKRQRTETNFGPDFITSFLTEIKNVDILDELVTFLHILKEDPKNYEEAMSSVDSSF